MCICYDSLHFQVFGRSESSSVVNTLLVFFKFLRIWVSLHILRDHLLMQEDSIFIIFLRILKLSDIVRTLLLMQHCCFFNAIPCISIIFDVSIALFRTSGSPHPDEIWFPEMQPGPGMPLRIGHRIPFQSMEVALASHGPRSTKMLWFKQVMFQLIFVTFYMMFWCGCWCFVGFPCFHDIHWYFIYVHWYSYIYIYSLIFIDVDWYS